MTRTEALVNIAQIFLRFQSQDRGTQPIFNFEFREIAQRCAHLVGADEQEIEDAAMELSRRIPWIG